MKKIEKDFKLIAMMRVKNEEEWLKKSILSMLPITDKIVILDDGSIDGTPEICAAFPELVEYHRQDEKFIDEARDKNHLLKWALDHNPDWILAMDGDEVLEELAPQTIVNEIQLLDPKNPQYTVFYLHFLYFWNSPDTYRVEPGIYSNFWQARLFSLKNQNRHLAFLPTQHGSNFHCGSIPGNLRNLPRKLDVKVKHYGYLDSEQRERKYRWYCNNDPEQASQGYYEHLTSEEGMILANWKERTEASSASFVKDTMYYQFSRPEILELVPEDVSYVLDIGCGFGHLGKAIKNKISTAKVFGIEVDFMAGQAASKLLDDVLVGNIESLHLPYSYERFDCIILADVLEHLQDPWKVLLKLHRYLARDGVMLISVPNIRNLGIIDQLLCGNWRYQQAGILDSTHLRFFTAREFRRLLKKSGYKILHVHGIEDLSLEPLTLASSSYFTEIGNHFEWGSLDQRTVNELHTIQLLFQVQKAQPGEAAKERKLTSIIIPVCNNLELTRACIQSIFAHTLEPFELIIVDNGSTDGTVEYLKGITDVQLIQNQENEGFPRACNQGILHARGEYLVIINNDVIVPDGWLGNLIDHLDDEERVGIVGVCSNYVGGSQKTKGYYKSLADYYEFAREFYWENEGEYLLTYRLAGLCMLISKDVIQQIGGFDERFTPGNFEDDDFCLRAAIANYKMVIAKDVFVHHFGSMTFKKDQEEYRKLLAINWGKFKLKWGIDFAIDHPNNICLADIVSQYKYVTNPSRNYYTPVDQGEEREKITAFDQMFFERQIMNKDACDLGYWQEHFCTKLARKEAVQGQILDAGCGTGEIDIWLAREGYDITGVDISPVAIQRAVNHLLAESKEIQARIKFCQFPLERLPFSDDSFDICFMFEVLEHIYDPEPVFKELGRVLNSAGLIVLTVPLEDYYHDSTHVHSFTPDSLKEMLNKFAKDIQVESFPIEHQIVARVRKISY